jgi:DtxR family Mn-dependent transcriptional regulator
MHISSAVEDYAKAIYALQERGDGCAVTTNALAERLHVTPASASAMVMKLDGIGLVTRASEARSTCSADRSRVR